MQVLTIKGKKTDNQNKSKESYISKSLVVDATNSCVIDHFIVEYDT